MPNGLPERNIPRPMFGGGGGVSPGGTSSMSRIAQGGGGGTGGGILPILGSAFVGGIGALAGSREGEKSRRSQERMQREQRAHELEMLRRSNLLPDWAYGILKSALSAPMGQHGGFARAMQSVQPEQSESVSPIKSRLGGA